MIYVQKRQSQYGNASTKLVTRIGARRTPGRGDPGRCDIPHIFRAHRYSGRYLAVITQNMPLTCGFISTVGRIPDRGEVSYRPVICEPVNTEE